MKRVRQSLALLSTCTLSSVVPAARGLASRSPPNRRPCCRVGVIGGGASGMFAAAAAADALKQNRVRDGEVIVLESGKRTMTKVSISGGGRCNVMHDTEKPLPVILGGYPRGEKELRGLMTKRFSPQDARGWFTKRGVSLKTEADGRMFPTTDDSQTIVDTIANAAKDAGVDVRTSQTVLDVNKVDDQFEITCGKRREGAEVTKEAFDAIILATGSAPAGYAIAKHLGHSLVKPVPSLFTLNAKSQVKEGGVLHGLSGISVPWARATFRVSVPGKKKKKVFEQEGPLLITHHGISGPAALRLSAFAAREFHEANYRGDVVVHWAPELGNREQIEESLWRMTRSSPKKMVSSACPLQLADGSSAIPRRLWTALVLESGFEQSMMWCEAPKKKVRRLAAMVSEFVVDVSSKGTFKEEFVKAGGIPLREINMKNMESKKCPGLFCCGELIDVDGVTGGFNFMNCWSTGFVAGNGAAEYAQGTVEEESTAVQ